MFICVFTTEPSFRTKKYTKDGCEGERSSHGRKTVFCIFVYLCNMRTSRKKNSEREAPPPKKCSTTDPLVQQLQNYYYSYLR